MTEEIHPATKDEALAKPKVFISYSWTSPSHQEIVRNWAERLLADGIEVVLDQFDLVEGNDKNSFMESMVTDSSITHILAICDKAYAEKANARKAGVGTESQIISQEVYAKVKQSKFIPIVVEFDAENKQPYLPVFFQSRIWVNFSSSESVNENWEKLIRHLFGKPYHQKPTVGGPPLYITRSIASPVNPIFGKLTVLRQAITENKRGLDSYRNDFLESVFSYSDKLRTRAHPKADEFHIQVLETCRLLKPVRDAIVDWVDIESINPETEDYTERIIKFLEQLLALRAKPKEVTSWNDSWFEAHKFNAYETFMYIVAKLIKNERYKTLNAIFYSSYLVDDDRSNKDFVRFIAFSAICNTLQSALKKDNKNGDYYSPAAELMQRTADRTDVPFASIMEAEALIYLMSLLTKQVKWYPGTLHYQSFGNGFPFFTRTAQRKHFKKLAIIAGEENVEVLKKKMEEGLNLIQQEGWFGMRFDRSLGSIINFDNMNTLT